MPRNVLIDIPPSQMTSMVSLIGEYVEKLDAHILKISPPLKNPENIRLIIGGALGLISLGLSIWALVDSINIAQEDEERIELFKGNTTEQAFGFFKNRIQSANLNSKAGASVDIVISTTILSMCLFYLLSRVSEKNRIAVETTYNMPAVTLGDLLPEAKVLFRKIDLTFEDGLTIGGIRDALLEKQYELVRINKSLDETNNSSSQIEMGVMRNEEQDEKEPTSRLLLTT